MNNIMVEVDYKYQWEVCGDFKVIAVLGLQALNMKYSCFLCEWEAMPEAPIVLGNIGPTDNH